ncbi:MAG TPA: hypothetical protein DCL21_05145, partial [Alphaproteobacteria bacterium]|nr:hypothetical protein [Alphaproteobacteria bacterium]
MILFTRTVAFLTFLLFAVTAQANTLKIGVDAIGENFDFRYTLDANSYRVLKLMTTGLLESVKEDSSAAEIIEKTPTSYTLKLKDIYFTDKTPLTSTDIKNMYEDLMRNKKVTVYKSTLENIKSIKIIDTKTIKFNFKKLDNFPTAKFTIPIFKNTENGMVGLGPYIMEEFKFPYTLKLKAIDKSLHYQTIEFIPNSLPVVRIIKLLKGEVDVLHSGLQALQVNLLKEKGYDIYSSKGSNYAYLGFNHKDETVGKKAIRQAIAYGIDVDSIIHYLYLDYAKKAGSLLPTEHNGYKAKFIKYNKQKAINILEEHGYAADKNGVRVRIDFSVTNNNQSLRFAQILQDQLKEVGIELNLLTSDWGRFYNDIKAGNVQMYALAWVGIFDGDIYKELFNSASMGDGGLNRSFYSNPEMDNLSNKVVNEKLTKQELIN